MSAEPVQFVTLLDGLEVRMGIGIHERELAEAQRVTLSVRLTIAYGQAPVADEIGEVLDYDYVRDGILHLAASRHFNLQETLCEEVARLCFRDPRVRAVRVRSAKPDIYPDASVGCEIERVNPEPDPGKSCLFKPKCSEPNSSRRDG